MTETADVVVFGSGVNGANAACALAFAGAQPLLEQASFRLRRFGAFDRRL